MWVVLLCRDKAPFMLIVEVLSAEGEDPDQAAAIEEARADDGSDTEVSMMEERTGSHAAAGPGTEPPQGGHAVSKGNI